MSLQCGCNLKIHLPIRYPRYNARDNQTICQELRHVLAEQSGLTRAIGSAPIERGLRPTMEINRYGLYHGLTKIRQIRQNTYRHRPPDENEPFYPLSKGPRCTAVCNTLPKGNHTITRHTSRYYYGQRQPIYLRIMEAHHRETRNWTTIKHGISSTNGRTNGGDEQDTGIVSTSIYQLSARQLERIITFREIRIQ